MFDKLRSIIIKFVEALLPIIFIFSVLVATISFVGMSGGGFFTFLIALIVSTVINMFGFYILFLLIDIRESLQKIASKE